MGGESLLEQQSVPDKLSQPVPLCQELYMVLGLLSLLVHVAQG